ncbi:MAG: hypothetical protein ACRDY7_13350 [Acidimicrobiia bacterium]
MSTVTLAAGEHNGITTIVHTVLTEKLEESPWKERTVEKMGDRALRLEITDRSEATTIKLESGKVFMLSEHHDPATLHIKVATTKLFPLLLGIPLTGGHFPALWSKGGRKLLAQMAKRKIVIKGLLTHPVTSIRSLQVLGVPKEIARR